MRLGIDVGGTKIEAAAFDQHGQVLFRHRLATPQGNYAETLRSISCLVNEAKQQLACDVSIGLGTPGSSSAKTGVMKNCNSTCLNGQRFQQDLESLLKQPVRMANDANCFALSEAVDGEGQNAAVVFGVILGTGVGGGLVVNKQLLNGTNHIAGEWGHNPMPTQGLSSELLGRACYCGRRDCIETYLSGPGFAETHRRVSGQQLTA